MPITPTENSAPNMGYTFPSYAKEERPKMPQKKALRSKLSRERATQLECNFFIRKQHYSLFRIKARNKKKETL